MCVVAVVLQWFVLMQVPAFAARCLWRRRCQLREVAVAAAAAGGGWWRGLSPRLGSASVVVMPPVGAYSAVFDSYTGSTSPCSLLLGLAL